jgi:hypothetical protein
MQVLHLSSLRSKVGNPFIDATQDDSKFIPEEYDAPMHPMPQRKMIERATGSAMN